MAQLLLFDDQKGGIISSAEMQSRRAREAKKLKGETKKKKNKPNNRFRVFGIKKFKKVFCFVWFLCLNGDYENDACVNEVCVM